MQAVTLSVQGKKTMLDLWRPRLYFPYFAFFSLSLDNDRSRVKSEPFPSPLDPPTKTLTLVVPAYNEEERLPGMLKTTLEYLEDRHGRDRQAKGGQ